MKFQRDEQTEQDPAEERGGRIKIAFQHHRYFAGQHIPDDTSADGGENSAEDDSGQSKSEIQSLLGADCGKNPQPDSIK